MQEVRGSNPRRSTQVRQINSKSRARSSRACYSSKIQQRSRTPLSDSAHHPSAAARPVAVSAGRATAGRWTAIRAKVAILMAMTVGDQMPLAEVKRRLSEVVDRLEREHGRVVITKHGHPAAVVISVED